MVALASLVACDASNNRRNGVVNRTPFYGQGYNFNQPYYNNCGQSGANYMNPYNNQQIYCQYNNGLPQFYNNMMQPFANDSFGNPCLMGTPIYDQYSGYMVCPEYYYPMGM